jgi:arylsulfatase
MKALLKLGIAACAGLICLSANGVAQEILPHPDSPFRGVIKQSYKNSTPDKLPLLKAPAGAPNILLILLDDTGYGQTSTFGGFVPTPTLDRLAAGGLRYTCFHVTAMCSPTRAALLTGRNHHSVSMGAVADFATGYPGYSSVIPKSAAFVSEILRQNGYSTAAFGKWHMTPEWETSASGPFDRWPTHQGFDHFYGFIGALTNQWAPELFNDNQPVQMEVPPGRKGDYTLNEDLASKAIDWISTEKAISPGRPFFVYYAPGATHTPLQAPKAWIDQFKGKFDMGWDKAREIVFQRQKELGVIPQDAKLTLRPAEIPAYDERTPVEKKIAARLMEVYAGYLAQTDYEIGRVVDAIERSGQLDNTLILYIDGDNGASVEGGLNGTFNDMAERQGAPEPPEVMIKHLDAFGGPASDAHYPIGWAWAGNTPFQWGKQIASHFGGTRNPLVVFWPNRIKDAGGVRWQFHHVIDIAPTLLDVAGIPQPTEVNGAVQKPMEGVSMAYTFDDAKAPSRHTEQYFEMMANRAIYKEGWVAGARSGRLPWIRMGGPTDFEKQPWELYHVAVDCSEADNLAKENPAKLKELQIQFFDQAAKYHVFPLDSRYSERYDPSTRPKFDEGRTRFVYAGRTIRVPEGLAPNFKNKSFTITANIEVPKSGADGVLATEGGRFGGWAFYIKGGKPTFTYNYFSQQVTTIASPVALAPGAVEMEFSFEYDGGGIGKGGKGTLYVNGKQVGEARIAKTEPVRYSPDETFDVGEDTGTPAGDYECPFAFTGKIKSLEVDISPHPLSSKWIEELEKETEDLSEEVQ